MSDNDALPQTLVKLSNLFEKEFGAYDQSVRFVFNSYQSNNELVQVFAKIGVLLHLYGPFPGFEERTGICKMAQHISENGSDIDNSLDEGSVKAFETIRKCRDTGDGEWSFASKYCHFSRLDGCENYPIFDSRAERAVMWLQAVGKVHNNTVKFWKDNYDYSVWLDAIKQCMSLSLGALDNYKKTDQALYELGYILKEIQDEEKITDKDLKTITTNAVVQKSHEFLESRSKVL